MRRFKHAFIVIVVLVFLLSEGNLFGQSRPFPQNVDYPYGYQTSVITASNVQTAYNRWKGKFLKRCGGKLRVCWEDTTQTRSEGMGYGMLLTAYFGEKGKFDSLFAFYKSKRTATALNLMAWNVTCGGILDQGSATDGDLDVAFALIVAYYQWGEDYFIEADSIITILKDHYFVDCGTDIYTMKPGGYFGGCHLTDISYYTPAYFKVFAEETGDDFWYDVADDAYTILENGANDDTGLVPDWQSYDGVPGGDPPSRDSIYHYDACRTPWRMALDYIWNDDMYAEDWCYTISDFANSIGASNIRDGYKLDGTVVGATNNSSFVGGFTVGGMCYSQSMVDNFATRLLSLDGVGWDDTYYNFSLRCLYMLVLTGNFWNPEEELGIEETDSLPGEFYLRQNSPNPFTITTTIEYSIAESDFVQLKIYNIAGQEIKSLVREVMSAGKHTVNVELNDLAPGVYFYRLEAGGNTIPKKMILLR